MEEFKNIYFVINLLKVIFIYSHMGITSLMTTVKRLRFSHIYIQIESL